MPHNVFEWNTYKYILTGVAAAQAGRDLETKKASTVAFVLEAIYKKDGVFKYPEVFQCENGPKCKSDITKLLEKQKIDIRRTITNSKHTHTAFVNTFEKQLVKQLFKPMEA